VALHQGPQAHQPSLYIISITAMFFIGGIFASLIRVELLTPQG